MLVVLFHYLAAMSKAECNTIVFSSSATVYGDPQYLPYDEEHPTNPVNSIWAL